MAVVEEIVVVPLATDSAEGQDNIARTVEERTRQVEAAGAAKVVRRANELAGSRKEQGTACVVSLAFEYAAFCAAECVSPGWCGVVNQCLQLLDGGHAPLSAHVGAGGIVFGGEHATFRGVGGVGTLQVLDNKSITSQGGGGK